MPWGAQQDVQLFATCESAGIHNAYLGRVALGGFTQGAYGHVAFDLPPELVAAFEAPNEQCSWRIALNGSGAFVLDGMAFE